MGDMPDCQNSHVHCMHCCCCCYSWGLGSRNLFVRLYSLTTIIILPNVVPRTTPFISGHCPGDYNLQSSLHLGRQPSRSQGSHGKRRNRKRKIFERLEKAVSLTAGQPIHHTSSTPDSEGGVFATVDDT